MLHKWLTFPSNFSPIPKRVMDGSEPGESVPAAVLSGAPTDLQARTVRYVGPTHLISRSHTNTSQHLQALEDSYTVWHLERITLAYGLGCPSQGSPMGEPAHGLAVICRLHEWTQDRVQVQGGCHQLCQQAGLRVLCPGAQQTEVCPQGLCQPLYSQPQEAQDCIDQIRVGFRGQGAAYVYTRSTRISNIFTYQCPVVVAELP